MHGLRKAAYGPEVAHVKTAYRRRRIAGLHPDSIGDQGDGSSLRAHRPDVLSLPQLFRRHGYYTAGISKVLHDAPGMDNSREWEFSVA